MALLIKNKPKLFIPLLKRDEASLPKPKLERIASSAKPIKPETQRDTSSIFNYVDLLNGFRGRYGALYFKPINDDNFIELKHFEVKSKEDLKAYKESLESILSKSNLGFILRPKITGSTGNTLVIEVHNPKSTSYLPEFMKFSVQLQEKFEFGNIVGYIPKVSYGLEKNNGYTPTFETQKPYSTFSTSELNNHFAAFLDTREVRDFINK